jgi:hypothetical protein
MARGYFFVERKAGEAVDLIAFHPKAKVGKAAVNTGSGDERDHREYHHPVVKNEPLKHGEWLA